MRGMGKPVSIDLMPLGATTLCKPIGGRGGFQSLLRKLQYQLDGRHLEVSRADLERTRGMRSATALLQSLQAGIKLAGTTASEGYPFCGRR